VKRIRPFTFFEPTSVPEAARLVAEVGAGAHPLAGGTDLLVDMKLGRIRPSAVVNLKRIVGLDRIERVAGGIRIGSLVRISAIESSPIVREQHTALWQAAGLLASRPVRNLATIGGNLGRASPASDVAPPLIVHEARVRVEGLEGPRDLPIEELFVGPGVTSLAVHEIITSVFLPDPAPRTGTTHRKLGKRGGGWDLALVGVSVGVVLAETGEVADVRIALASVGPTPVRAREAEGALAGLAPTEAALAATARIAAEEIRPVDDVRADASYRRALACALTRRALEEALAFARGEVAPR
jgi:CO/xanthine dehydrogenase FAD-binding subunit